jgi:hypothetical protein
VRDHHDAVAGEADRRAGLGIEHAADPGDLGEVVATADRAERAREAQAVRRGIAARRQRVGCGRVRQIARREPAQVVGDAVELGERLDSRAPHGVEQRVGIDVVEHGRLERGAQAALEPVGRDPLDAGDRDPRAAAGVATDEVRVHDVAARDHGADREAAAGVQVRHAGGVHAALELRDDGELARGLALHPHVGAADEDRFDHGGR